MCPGCGRCGRGDPARPHSVRPCGPALLAVGVAEGRPGGVPSTVVRGVWCQALSPPPAARPLERAVWGPLPTCCGRGVCGCGGPALSPWLHALWGAACRWGGGGPSLGGLACHRCEGRLVSGAVPPPAARPLERAAGVPVCVCVRVRALLGRVGRAGLPGAFWCASPFPLAALSFCFAWPPPGWGCPPLSRCCCRSSLPWRCALVVFFLFFFFFGPPLPGSPVRSRLVCVSRLAVGCSLVVAPPASPPFLCLAVFVAPAWCLGFFFFFFFLLVLLPSVRPRCLRLSLVSGPGCPGPRRCALFALLAFRFSALRALLSLFRAFPPGLLAAPRVVAAPPPPFVSRGFRRCRSVLCAACCVVLCVPGCGAAPRCCALCRPVLCCRVLCCARLVPPLVAPCPLALPVALGPCALRRCVLRCSRAVCSVCVFCRGAVVRAVVRRSALCCVCPGVLCCAFPVLSALCGAVLRCAGALALCCSCGACCCWRLVLWCAAVCCAVSCGVPWCGAGYGGPWLSAGGVFRCRCPCLAAWSASLWLVWFAVVPGTCIGV